MCCLGLTLSPHCVIHHDNVFIPPHDVYTFCSVQVLCIWLCLEYLHLGIKCIHCVFVVNMYV